MKLEVIACNVCRDHTKSTTPYEVRKDGAVATVDLCEEDGAPFAEALAGERKVRVIEGRRAPRPRRTTAQVTTLEEIEARKQQ